MLNCSLFFCPSRVTSRANIEETQYSIHTNGQKTNGIFNSYQNSDSLGFCPLVPSSFPFHHRGLVGLSAYNSYASVQSLFLSCAVSALLRLAWLLTFNTAVKSDEDLRSIKTKLLQILLVGHSLEG